MLEAYANVALLEERRLRAARLVIATRLGESWRSAVHVTLHRDMDVTATLERRQAGGPLLMDAVLSCLVRTLAEHPAFNATFDGEMYRLYRDVNLGIAVDSPRGLVVPVIHHAESLDPPTLSERRRALQDLAQRWAHTPADLSAGTFTISNLGPLGVDHFTPIINPPQVATLGIGRLRGTTEAWERDEPPRFRRLLGMSLSFDHRVVDGANAARFLQSMQDGLNHSP